MVNLVEEAVSYDLDVYDLSRFCGMAPSSRVDFVELTEAQLQEIEEKADNWLMGAQGITPVINDRKSCDLVTVKKYLNSAV